MFQGSTNKRQNIEIDSLIGRNTRIEGDVEFNGGLHVDGFISGNVHCDTTEPSHLALSEHGHVEGEIHVTDIELDGTVVGDVFATGRLELGANARIDGSVYYNILQMVGGASVNGKLVHDPSLEHMGQPAMLSHNKSEADQSFDKSSSKSSDKPSKDSTFDGGGQPKDHSFGGA